MSINSQTVEPTSRTNLTNARQAASRLVVFRSLLKDPIIAAYIELMDILVSPQYDTNQIMESYHELAYKLISAQTPGAWPDAWQRYLIRATLTDNNALSRALEQHPLENLSTDLATAARYDLELLETLYQIDGLTIKKELAPRVHGDGYFFSWDHLVFSPSEECPAAALMHSLADWGDLLPVLAKHYQNFGTGIFSEFKAFRWHDGHLQGIPHPDPAGFEDLIGLNDQKQVLCSNTESLLAGFPANNVLLYGKRGTGKSSMVKAALNRYCEQGLRLVEIAKGAMHDLPQVLEMLRGRTLKFIIFIDDLSFEEYEVEYKGLKGILEGGLSPLPDNVRIYATSNRRHLVREYFADRNTDEEIHGDDTVQEKLSVADRFGLSIFFPTPDQVKYLNIVFALAERYDLDIDREELQARAIRWEKYNNGLSGRTARQFVDNLRAELHRKNTSS